MEMEVEEIFPKRLKALRKSRRLTQAEIGELLGVTTHTVCAMESGLRGTTIEKLVILAKFYNVSTDYLLGLKDDPQ